MDLENILRLAEKGHREELKKYVASFKIPNKHNAKLCPTCMDIARGWAKIAEAERCESSVVLYIP